MWEYDDLLMRKMISDMFLKKWWEDNMSHIFWQFSLQEMYQNPLDIRDHATDDARLMGHKLHSWCPIRNLRFRVNILRKWSNESNIMMREKHGNLVFCTIGCNRPDSPDSDIPEDRMHPYGIRLECREFLLESHSMPERKRRENKHESAFPDGRLPMIAIEFHFFPEIAERRHHPMSIIFSTSYEIRIVMHDEDSLLSWEDLIELSHPILWIVLRNIDHLRKIARSTPSQYWQEWIDRICFI